MSRGRQTAVGLGLAALIAGAWLAVHVYGVFFHAWTAAGALVAPVLVVLQCWLGVGLFITAHDAMHGSLAPGRPRVNRWGGQLAVGLYAGFSFPRLLRKHHEHHRRPGSEQDPDFHHENPTAFWRWYLSFFRRYFGMPELAVVATALALHLLLGARPLNAAVFWGLPAILSSLQLFAFGTWLPHRHGSEPHHAFVDHHRARSNRSSWWASLFSCYHFGGFHHEHHTHPHLPWWRLPEARRA